MRVYLKTTRRILREAEAPKASLSQGRVGRTGVRVAGWLILLPNVGSSPDLAARELLALFHGHVAWVWLVPQLRGRILPRPERTCWP